MWRDTLGIEDFGVNPDEGWTTQIDDVVVAPDGTINFTGFWGDYELNIDGQAYPLTLLKGDTLYSVPVAPGDYNADGIVDMADYVVWRKSFGSSTDLRADGNGDLMIDDGDYGVWRTYFGRVYSLDEGASVTVPEPRSFLLILAGGPFAALRVTRRIRDQGR
jgi:hypothetical protein